MNQYDGISEVSFPSSHLISLCPTDEEVIFVKIYLEDSSHGTKSQIYEWVAWDEPWSLTLWKDTHFVAPAFLVREEHDNETKVLRKLPHSECFSRGELSGIPNSDAAINTCDGLVSIDYNLDSCLLLFVHQDT